MQAATDAGRVLVSADTDFGDLLFRGSVASPSAVLLRRAPHGIEAVGQLLVDALAIVEEPLQTGAISVVTPERIRYRLLPIQGPEPG
jgi:predicted nuclease of predicted toxin-antitoxin system